jgi:L,D-peptidoglycan transpeptidase YkuD (ErfK/YbiS/YcfS/YnhG family)
MGWAHAFRQFRRAGEMLKVEGDRRSPAGVYRIGASFGFTAARRRDHLRIGADTVCVDDVRSPAYNTITAQAAVGSGMRVERMRTNHRYREGLLVDYPTDAAARAGSCIFIHVWETPRQPTAGCIALAEARVKGLQEFAAPGAVLAILPRHAMQRLSPCLPREPAGAVN